MLEFDLSWHRGDFGLQVSAQTTAQVTGLCGVSGAGKSTLLALIAGLQRPDAGRIVLNNETLVDTQKRIFVAPEKRHIGLVFQEAHLFPHLSVKANLLYGFNRLKPAQRRLTLADIVTLLEIEHLLSRRPGLLSGGEKQRVAIGRALLYSPRLLLLDEPLSSLDEHRKQQILPFLVRIRDDLNMPMIMVSHAREEVRYLTDSCWHMHAGALQALTR